MHLPAPNEKEFELAPAGTHKAICYRVIDQGTQDIEWQGQAKKQHKVYIAWELPDELMSDGRPFTIGRGYTWSMSDKAALRADLESWRGVPFTEKDFGADGFDIKNILGKGCLLTVVHNSKQGKTYANISSVSKLMKGMDVPAPKNPPTYLWLDAARWQPEVFHTLSQNMQAKIMKSPEYQAIANGHDDHHTPAPDANDLPRDEIPF